MEHHINITPHLNILPPSLSRSNACHDRRLLLMVDIILFLYANTSPHLHILPRYPLGLTHAMIAGCYLWLVSSDGTVTAWDTRYGVQSYSTSLSVLCPTAMNPLNVNSTTLVRVSAVSVSEYGSTRESSMIHKDNNSSHNHQYYQYYLTVVLLGEGVTRASSLLHGPLSLPSGVPP